MPIAKAALPIFASLMIALPAAADHHAAGEHAAPEGAATEQAVKHTHGPNGGALIALGDAGLQAELILERAELVTVRVLDMQGKPVATDGGKLTLTFTESDGEKENYKLKAKTLANGEQAFQRKSDHVVEHIVGDPMRIMFKADGTKHVSKTFSYPHGPNGGELLPLGESGLIAELVVSGDTVSVHVLDAEKYPTDVAAAEVTLTFTESDGETEDYPIDAAAEVAGGSAFAVTDDHIAEHVMRDKTAVTLVVGDKPFTSKAIDYAGE